ncbi:hypothetical protein CLAIMM_04195, partial [Cladophialophora immunda]
SPNPPGSSDCWTRGFRKWQRSESSSSPGCRRTRDGELSAGSGTRSFDGAQARATQAKGKKGSGNKASCNPDWLPPLQRRQRRQRRPESSATRPTGSGPVGAW